jgi:hypothetical protein
MKRLFLTFLILLIVNFSIGCNSKENLYSKGQKEAINNCIEYINNSAFTSKANIDTNIVKFDNATNNSWESVWYEGEQVDSNVIDSSDWIITIGDTSGIDFNIFVCDSDTNEVLGYIPIE